MGDTAEKIPSMEECYRLLEECNVPENVVKHSERVREFALDLAGKIAGINMELVSAGALLHDIDKIETLEGNGRHGEPGARKLKEKGFFAVSEIVRKHVLENIFELESAEEKLVYYADKRIINGGIVTVKERLDFIREKYCSGDQACLKKLERIRPALEALESELMEMVKK